MKGVILAAGHGEDLKPLTANMPKPMIPILGKPLIEYTIDRLKENGITEITIVIGPEGIQIKEYFDNNPIEEVDITYIKQDTDQPGIDGAIMSISDHFRSEDLFLLTHCDIIADKTLVTRTLNAVENTGADMAMAVALQSEIQDFGVVSLHTNGLVDKIIPEGETKDGNYIVAGTFLLSGKIFEYLLKGTPFNLCFNELIKDGFEIASAIWNDSWIDVGRPWDLLRATSYLLEKVEYSKISSKSRVEPNVEIKGVVIIEDGAEILNGTVIKGPVYVGKNAFIGNNSLIRDHSAIYANSKIGMGVEIRSSVIMENASIARLSYVGASIIGRHATMHSGSITINTNTPPSPIETVIQGKKVIIPLEKFGAIIGPNAHIGVHSSLMPGTIIDDGVIVKPNQMISGFVSKE